MGVDHLFSEEKGLHCTPGNPPAATQKTRADVGLPQCPALRTWARAADWSPGPRPRSRDTRRPRKTNVQKVARGHDMYRPHYHRFTTRRSAPDLRQITGNRQQTLVDKPDLALLTGLPFTRTWHGKYRYRWRYVIQSCGVICRALPSPHPSSTDWLDPPRTKNGPETLLTCTRALALDVRARLQDPRLRRDGSPHR